MTKKDIPIIIIFKFLLLAEYRIQLYLSPILNKIKIITGTFILHLKNELRIHPLAKLPLIKYLPHNFLNFAHIKKMNNKEIVSLPQSVDSGATQRTCMLAHMIRQNKQAV